MSSVLYLYLLVVVLTLFTCYHKWQSTKSLRSVPTIGPNIPVLSYVGAFRFVNHALQMLEEGYQKYKSGVYKIAMQDRWLVLVTSPELIEEVRRLPDDTINFLDAAMDTLEAKYTFGPVLHRDHFFADIVRSHLTKHLDQVFDESHDEIISAFNHLLPHISDYWTPVQLLPLAQNVVSRGTNRVFVGLPLCRRPEYVELAIKHTVDVANTRKALGWFPGFTRYFATLFTNDSQKSVRLAKEYLSPIIQERLAVLKDVEGRPEKPKDILQSIIEVCLDRNYDIDVMAQTVLMMNFVSIHNTSNSFTQALFHLAAQPEYLEPLRAEIAAVVEAEGWTKYSIGKMHKLDSFMHESQRINGTGIVQLLRKTFKPVTLSNDVTIPPDTFVGAPLLSIQHDEEFYPNPGSFDPWRCSNKREKSGSEGLKYQYVSTSPEYLAFGHGKHACPGRFFAANEIKSMLCHVILNYDVKFENEGARPENAYIFLQSYPLATAKVLFRKRRV